MIIKTEIRIKEFNFWGNAVNITSRLTNREWCIIEGFLESRYDELSATQLNDMFAYYADELFETAGLDITEENVIERA